MGPVDLTPLHNAILRLAEGLERHLGVPDDEQLRDGLIQRFEFTYDLAHKTLRRVIQSRAADADKVAAMSFPELIRTADEQDLVAHGWPVWKHFRDKRNITSHTDDSDKARDVASQVPAFLDEVRALEQRLAAKLDP